MTFLNTSLYYENLTTNQPQLMCCAEECGCQFGNKIIKSVFAEKGCRSFSVELGPIITVLQTVYPTRTADNGEE